MGLDWSELLDIFNEWVKEEYQNKIEIRGLNPLLIKL
jgi:hypothetical protein